MQVDGVLASIILDDFFDVGESMMKAEPAIQKLCKEFGIPSMDHVAIDTWPSEHLQSCRFFDTTISSLQPPQAQSGLQISKALHEACRNMLLQHSFPVHMVYKHITGANLLGLRIFCAAAVHPVKMEGDLADSTRRRIMGLMYYRWAPAPANS